VKLCGFDFKDFYGDIGIGFTECHHNIPYQKWMAVKKLGYRIYQLFVPIAIE